MSEAPRNWSGDLTFCCGQSTQNQWQELLLITSYNNTYQEEYQIPIYILYEQRYAHKSWIALLGNRTYMNPLSNQFYLEHSMSDDWWVSRQEACDQPCIQQIMCADSYGGIQGGISCTGQRPPYSKLNVYVQPVLRPKFMSFSAAMLEQYHGYWCVFFIWLYTGSCCASVYLLVPWQNHHAAFDLCALRAYAQTVALLPSLPSFQLLLGLSKSIHCSLHGRLHVVG